MHILINGSFWTQPTVGSGQYLHNLLRWLPHVAPAARSTLLLPAAQQSAPLPLPPGCESLTLRTPFDTVRHNVGKNLAKLWFEQISVPHVARLLWQNKRAQQPVVLHVPYFAPPLHCVVPVVTTIPDIIPLVLPAYRGGVHVRLYMALVTHAVQQSNHVITFSQYSCNDIVTSIGVPANRVHPILLAAADHYQPAADRAAARAAVATRYGLSGPFVYYVGGLDQRKNLVTLLRAVAHLRDQGRLAATLAIAGRALGRSSALFPDIDSEIARLGLQAHVRRIDVPHADGPLLYQACTAFAFPSRYEGFGLPPLEAMACGAPVVASNASSLPEVVGDAALLVAPDDVAGWAAALERLLHAAPLRDDLRRRGLAQAARFSWQRVAQETAVLYAEAGCDRKFSVRVTYGRIAGRNRDLTNGRR